MVSNIFKATGTILGLVWLLSLPSSLGQSAGKRSDRRR